MTNALPGAIPSPIQPERDYTAERDAEVIPVARKILKALADREDLKMGSRTGDEVATAEFYQKMYLDVVVPILLESNLKLDNIQFLFSIMLQPIHMLKDVTISSFEMNQDLADAKKWGVSDIRDLRVRDLDGALKKEGETVDNQKSEQ